MKLDISTGDGTRTVERVEDFEIRSGGRVYVERDGTHETFDGELYGGSDHQ